MQSSKPSKKSLKKGEENAAETAAATETKPARSSRIPKATKPKAEGASVKVHRRSPVSSSLPHESTSTTAAHALPAAAAATVGGSIIDSVGLVAAPNAESRLDTGRVSKSALSREEVARLAYSYWEARGFTHGLADEDWVRAESELLARG